MIECGSYFDYDQLEYKIPMEFWKPITELSVPGVSSVYWISNLGRIYNTNSNTFVNQHLYGREGGEYLSASLYTIYGNKSVLVHRIVMIEFVGYDPDPSKDQIDHIDGNKFNNSIFNLRWVTCSENITAAYDLGIMPSGEDSPISKLTNEQVRNIAQMMQDGINRYTILDYIKSCGIISAYSVFISIYRRRCWKRVTEGYKFCEYDIRGFVFTEEEIHKVCQCLEKNMKHNDILIYLGYDISLLTRNELNNLYTAISHIKRGINYTEISSQYNIDRDSNKNTFTDKEVHYICKRMSEHASNKEILHELGYDVDVSRDKKEYHKYMDPLYRIKNKKFYTEISSQYNI